MPMEYIEESKRAEVVHLTKYKKWRSYKRIERARRFKTFDTTNEADVLVMCDCGKEFHVYQTDTIYQCECGRSYRVKQIVELLTLTTE